MSQVNQPTGNCQGNDLDRLIENELDPGIADVVIYLWQGGFDTFSSCQGGPGHAFHWPTIRINSGSLDLDTLENRVAGWLIKGRYSGFYIKRVNAYQNEEKPWLPDRQSFIEVEFWKLPEGTVVPPINQVTTLANPGQEWQVLGETEL